MELRCEHCGAPLTDEPNEKSTPARIYCIYCGYMNPRPKVKKEPPKPKVILEKTKPESKPNIEISNPSHNTEPAFTNLRLTLGEIKSLKVGMTLNKVNHFRQTFSEEEFYLFLNSLTIHEYRKIEMGLTEKEKVIARRNLSDDGLFPQVVPLHSSFHSSQKIHKQNSRNGFKQFLFIIAELWSVILVFRINIVLLSSLPLWEFQSMGWTFFNIVLLFLSNLLVLYGNWILFKRQPTTFLVTFYCFASLLSAIF